MGTRLSFKVAGTISPLYPAKPAASPHKARIPCLDLLGFIACMSASALLVWNLGAVINFAINLY